MKKKQYVLSLKNLSVVLTPNKNKWDIVVVLNRTKELWLKMTTVEPTQNDEVLDTIKEGDAELSKVYDLNTFFELKN
jgi:regulation of enolase protein 1 (concanavalin A-like superfamily)